MRYALLLTLTSASTSCASNLHNRHHRINTRHDEDALAYLRGGAGSPPAGALSREDVISKLNRVPTFAIADADDHVVPVQNEDGGHDLCWYIDASDAQELLGVTLAANPDVAGLHIAVTPLGVVFDLCGGWPVAAGEEPAEKKYLGGELRILGPRKAPDSMHDELQGQVRAQGLHAGSWSLPVFCHDSFQSEQIMPLFFSQDAFSAGWQRADVSMRMGDADDVPENLAIMDLRILVQQMMNTEVFNWQIFTFVTSEAAYKLAQEIQAADASSGDADSGDEESST